MVESLPAPPVPPDADLRDFPFVPMYRARLFGSSFHARSSDAGWRAGVTLWLKAWDQCPAGSLPDDDVDLCRLAELGRDVKTWRALKSEALRGWVLCSDGRMYHSVVAEVVMEALDRKLRQRHATDCSRIKKSNQRHQRNDPVPTYDEWLALRRGEVVALPVPDASPAPASSCPQGQDGLSLGTGGSVPRDNGGVSPRTTDNVPGENGSKGQGQGQGQGQGIGGDSSLRSESPPGGDERDSLDDAVQRERDDAAAWCRGDVAMSWCFAHGRLTHGEIRAIVERWLEEHDPRDVRDAIGTAQCTGKVDNATAYINRLLANKRVKDGAGYLRVVAGGARQGGGAATAEDLKPWDRYGVDEDDWRNA